MKKLTNFIKNVRKNDIIPPYYEDIYDKFLNGECETLVGWLYKYNNNQGMNLTIYLVPVDEFGDEDWDEKIFHSVYKYQDKFYDINGCFDNIDDIVSKLPYYDKTTHKIVLEENQIGEDNFYSEIPEHLIKKNNKNKKKYSKNIS